MFPKLPKSQGHRFDDAVRHPQRATIPFSPPLDHPLTYLPCEYDNCRRVSAAVPLFNWRVVTVLLPQNSRGDFEIENPFTSVGGPGWTSVWS